MSHLAYALKYRPKDFDEIVDQEHIAVTLKNAISRDKLAHAYLFSGPRGIGKTSTARILAKALNCIKGPTPKPCNKCDSCVQISEGRSMDVLEIDGASNRGIDEIRTLRDNVKFAPSFCRFKIYIIDEVHMLTTEAFNALLKTLEEPPAHVKFIFATTEPHKVLPTILSRCQRFDFHKITSEGIIAKLKQLCREENIQCEEEALFALTRASEGSLRDAEVVLDQLNSFSSGKITLEAVNSVLGLVSQEVIFNISDQLDKPHTADNLALLDNLIQQGKEPAQLIGSLIEHFRNMMLVKCGCSQLVVLPKEDKERLDGQSKSFALENILYCISVLTQTQERMKRQGLGRLLLEMALVKLSRQEELLPLSVLLEKLRKLEERLKGVSVMHAPQQKRETSVSAAPSVPLPAAAKPADSQAAQPKKTAEKDKRPQASEASSPVAIAVETPEAALPAAGIGLYLETVMKRWPQIIKEVRAKKISLGIFLGEARVLKAVNNTLTIGFLKDYDLHRESLLEAQNLKMIEDIAAGTLGTKVRMDIISCDVLPEPVIAEPPLEVEDIPIEAEGLEAPEESEEMNDIIQSAIEVFDGHIIPTED
ncbi:MAG: DNA polymerase III subunit gamma/tau [Candidatus Omnitrophica bacterium]|nr:DNA polymerase III subunit gamma/tau [Candidatus Omnitrophota bacterium]MBU4478335.1 DNA polymerase III subunit gamma/tau [Candidatus Omnitrophota bacterium]MCG2703400.1 DNA polymerase III subunit gamma/tau [Candidatus Omnitrophota bacterium]